MSDQQASTNLFDIKQLSHLMRTGLVTMMNMQRENIHHTVDYVQFTLPAQMAQLPQSRNLIEQQLLGKAPLSLLELERAFARIAKDRRIKGVILNIRGFAMPLANLQTLRDSIRRLRESGKRVVCYAMSYGNAEYYVASAADEIILQPGGIVATTGLLVEQTYIKDALDSVGIELDVVAITPYKGAFDTYSRTNPSPEAEEQRNWLLDSNFQQIVSGIAAGRAMTHDDVRAMIDAAPHIDTVAYQQGWVDALLSEEGLRNHLGAQEVQLWEQVDHLLPLPIPQPTDAYVAILPLTGSIFPGESADPPVDLPIPLVGGERMGDLTIVRQVRNLMNDEACKAVVLYIDSPGGSAAASEAMTTALEELSKKIPIVAYMDSVAASGGYYIATPADVIVAQPGTITGSIGVIAAKPIANEAYQKLKFNPVYYQRGANAKMFASVQPFTDEQRQAMRDIIERGYEQFLERVAAARKMKTETVDEMAGGRVWTGEQALERGLIDQLGGLYEAMAKARELAKLPVDAPVGILHGKGKPLPAQVAESLDPAASVAYWLDGVDRMLNGSAQMLMPIEWRIK